MKKYLSNIKSYIVFSLILYILEVLVTSIILVLPGYLMDHYADGGNIVQKLIACYIGMFIIYLIISYFSNRIADYRRIKFEKDIKKDFFNAVIERKYKEYHEYDIGEYLSMQANDISEMCQNYLSPLLSIFRSVIMIVVFGVSLIYFVDVSIALVILVLSGIVVFIPELTAKKLSDKNGIYLKSIGRYTSQIKLFFESHDILDQKSMKKIENIHEEELEAVLSNNMKFRRLNSAAMVINGGAVEFVSVVAFITIAILLSFGRITIGMATIAFMYSTKFTEPMYELNVNIGRIKSVNEIQNKLCRIINHEMINKEEAVSSVKNIEIHDVRKKFQNVEITIPDMKFCYPNKYLICGDNGVGKSVLFRMIMGFYKPDQGQIFYDKKANIDISMLISYAPQQPVIFDTDYKNNITLFGTYDDSKLSLYESFFPEEMIRRIKKTFHNQNLSGGEKQVIALLRALCSNKPILLLDEPFSAMNQEAIDKFMRKLDSIDSMVLIIAHNINEYMQMFEETYSISSEKIKLI